MKIREINKVLNNTKIAGIGKDKNGQFYLISDIFIVKVDINKLANSKLLVKKFNRYFKQDINTFVSEIPNAKMKLRTRTKSIENFEDFIFRIAKKGEASFLEFVGYNKDKTRVCFSNTKNKQNIVINSDLYHIVKKYDVALGCGAYDNINFYDNGKMVASVCPLAIRDKSNKDIIKDFKY